ncbi:MAG: methyltransferase domain-containing protein [Proteobacteria bacterium]|nr:methyltransferase domain-containing protein [Pseudomonadota bacterium]MDA1058315.1 methyltransferase domain-containing protein [Pseudomonadota bacterium]
MASDPYAKIVDTEPALVRTIGERLEVRAAHPDQRAMLDAYLADIVWPQDARVVEIGCGTGPVARALASRPEPGAVLGLDPSPILIERAKELASGLPKLTFEVGDARNLAQADATFDVVVFHTALCHIPGPEKALAEARRILKSGGWLAVFDGDYASATVAIAEHDPLQACSRAVTDHNVMDRWIVRRLPAMANAAGFNITRFRSHGYAEVVDPVYMLGHAERGAEVLAAQGVIGADLAEALKREARRRVTDHAFFGHIAYASLVARKP